jgi:hypothetical protein
MKLLAICKLVVIAGFITVSLAACSIQLKTDDQKRALTRLDEYTKSLANIENKTCDQIDTDTDHKVSCYYTDKVSNQVIQLDCPYEASLQWGSMCKPYNQMKNVPAAS